MRRKQLLKLVIGVTLVAVLAIALPLGGGCAPKPAAPPVVAPPAEELPIYTWRFQTLFPPPQQQAMMVPWAEDVRKATGGRVQIELFCGGELMPDDQVLIAVQDGTLDFGAGLAQTCNAPLPDYVMAFSGISPFIWNSSTEMLTIWNERGMNELFAEQWEALGGIHFLGNCPADPISVASTKPLRTVADLDGLKINAFEVVAYPFEQHGASSIFLPFEELYMAGKTGAVDAMIWSGATEMYTNAYYEAFPYFMSQPVNGAADNIWYCNLDLWNSMPDDIQEIITALYKSVQLRFATYYYTGESYYRQQLPNVVEFDPDEWETLKQTQYALWDELAAESPWAAEVVKILKDYAAEVEASNWYR